MASVSIYNTTRFTALASGDVIGMVDISDATQSAHGSLDSITIVNFFATVPVPVVVTSASAAAFAVGLTGATNSAFKVDASTALQVAGLTVKGAVTGGTVAVVVTDSGADANLTLNAKGAGTIGIGSVSTGRVTITPVTTITGSLTLSATLVAAAANFSGNVVVNSAITLASTGAVSGITTLAGTGAVSGFTTAGFSGAVTVTVSGMTNSVKLAQMSDATTLGVVSLNGSVTSTGMLGVAGGGGTDKNLYNQSPTGGGHVWNINNAPIASLTASTFTVLVATTAVQALTATTYVGSGNMTATGTSASILTLNGAAGSTAGMTLNAANTSREADIFFQQATTDRWQMGMASGSATPAFNIFSQGVGNNALSLAYSTGAATFIAGISCTTGTFSTSAKTASGATSVPDSSATTLFSTASEGSYFITGYDAGGTNLGFTFVVHSDGTNTPVLWTGVLSGLITGAMSGANLRVTQTTGTTKTINWSYLRIAT